MRNGWHIMCVWFIDVHIWIGSILEFGDEMAMFYVWLKGMDSTMFSILLGWFSPIGWMEFVTPLAYLICGTHKLTTSFPMDQFLPTLSLPWCSPSAPLPRAALPHLATLSSSLRYIGAIAALDTHWNCSRVRPMLEPPHLPDVAHIALVSPPNYGGPACPTCTRWVRTRMGRTSACRCMIDIANDILYL